VRSAGGFVALDPWNDNRRTDFTIEAYKMLPPDSPPVRSVKDSWLSGHAIFGIKSEIDGKERMLPASLVELWRTSRIPAEALPRLLWQMQSWLKKNDYVPPQAFKIQLWIMVLASLISFSLTPIIYSVSDFDPIYDGLFMLILVLMAVLGFCIVLRRRARYRRQMDWALAHL
jgi:hypothetical protein